ncbi:hypothetical protein NMY22_g18197 [Coprinellus aureogranulatus]|nr:hypothetical protein NMY22_g18197 [Coprinellus aureogranulatus]
MVIIRTRNITQDVALMNMGDNDIVIPILGATGAGKSSFINAYMKAKGQRGEAKVGDTLVPCTVGLEAFVVDAHGRRVVLVDTPGFDNPAAVG